ncbi:MAG: LTA synthase family protein, partial [Pygmaiobacter sp.]
EFGALTGFSTSFLPTGSIAYMEYIRDDFPCYPRFLKENGYKTIALHPFDSTIYKRDESYPKMGFDVFYGQEDFVNPEKHGAYIDEKETVRKLIELYEQATVEGDPVFIHTVTMQNHIPNAPDEYAADYKVNATIEGVDPYYKSCLESSATGLRDIDESIGLLLDYFSACDRDVVVLLFGDHQTAIGDRKGVELLDELPEFTSLSEEQKHTATHTVPYLMWANFEQKDAETAGMMPPYQLLATTLKEYNVLRPAYFDWLASSQATLKGINIGRVIEPDGTLGGTVKGASEAQWGVLERQKLLQYDAMFGQNWAHEAMYG